MFDPSLHLPVSPAMFQDIFHAPSGQEIVRILFRWAHFVGGITWIGMLYFFNLVNVNFMKTLDAPTKKIVVPELLPRALWYFRWGAVVTVLAGMAYYAMYIIAPDVKNANSLGNAGANTWLVFFGWLAQGKMPEWAANAKTRPMLESTGNSLVALLPENPEGLLKSFRKPRPDGEPGGPDDADPQRGGPPVPPRRS